MTVATSASEGRSRLRQLVLDYGRDRPYYRSPGYDETSTRERFVNRLFQALGWDVLDEQARGPARDVVFHQRLQSSAQVAGDELWDADLDPEELAARQVTSRIPDYAFRADGEVRFFLEAKVPRISLDGRGPAFQVKSYAWSQRVPVGVLASFEGLRVFDCRLRPVYEEPRFGLLPGLSLSWNQYEDHWPRLWETLSCEAVAEGSLERLLGTPPRSQRAKPVDQAFLTELEQWRERLGQDLLDRNPDLTAWDLSEATQRILDRLVFVRVCEDRQVEPSIVLRGYARRTDAYQQLRAEFRRLDGAYNGALFAEHFSERLEVGDGVLQRLIEHLYFPRSPYRFDVIGADLLGAVYERFLGKELTVSGTRVVLEEKPEVRHAGGVYYTPKWVVDYIVASCLDPLLEGRTPRTARNLRILDPACGSGSFLLGALEYLIRWHENYYSTHPDETPERHYQAADGRQRLTADSKADLLAACLFGVDIDPQAVEVAQLNLYLKVLESETRDSLRAQIRLFHGALLPSLTGNIRSGNSLLGPDQVPMALLYDEERRRRINPFDWRDEQRGFARVFRDRGGFDAVIGNPPYTRVQVLRETRPEETRLYAQLYRTGSTGSFDIASLFIERGLSLLRPAARSSSSGGRLSYIVTRQFSETEAGAPVRDLLRDARLEELIDFRHGLVFEGVSAYTTIVRATPGSSRDFTLIRVPPPPSAGALVKAAAPGSPLRAQLPLSNLGQGPWPLALPLEQTLLDRLAGEHPTLSRVSGDSIFQGVITGADSVFRALDDGPDPGNRNLRIVRPRILASSERSVAVERALLRPVLAGRTDFRRFWTRSPVEWLLLPYERPEPGASFRLIPPARLRSAYPAGWAWLHRNQGRLLQRSGTWGDGNWPAFSRRQNLELFDAPKVLVPYMVEDLCAHYDDSGAFFVNVSTGGYGVAIDGDSGVQPVFLAALLNSQLLSWILRHYSRAFRGGWFAARKGNLERLPIVVPDRAAQEAVCELYHECRELTQRLQDATGGYDRDTLEGLVDQHVSRFDDSIFDLYRLSDAERRLVKAET